MSGVGPSRQFLRGGVTSELPLTTDIGRSMQGRLNRHESFALSSNMCLGAEQQVWAWVYHACRDNTGYENIRDHCAYIRHLPNKRFAQSNSNGPRASTSD